MEVQSGNLMRSRCTFGPAHLINSTVVQDLTVEMIYSEQIKSGLKTGLYDTVMRNGKQMLTIYVRVWMGIKNLLKSRLGKILSLY